MTLEIQSCSSNIRDIRHNIFGSRHSQSGTDISSRFRCDSSADFHPLQALLWENLLPVVLSKVLKQSARTGSWLLFILNNKCVPFSVILTWLHFSSVCRVKQLALYQWGVGGVLVWLYMSRIKCEPVSCTLLWKMHITGNTFCKAKQFLAPEGKRAACYDTHPADCFSSFV